MANASVAWGLDVGTTGLKAIKLRREGDRVIVEAFDVVDHDQFLTEPDVNRDETIRATLQKFLERNPLNRRDSLYIGVPGSTTFARFVKLPPVEPKKIPEIVKFEAQQQIPFPLEQVNWDFKTFTTPDSPDVEVGIFAMKKELVFGVLSNFTVNDITVEGVQMNPLAVFNGMSYDEAADGKGTVLLDIGADHTDLIILDKGRLWLRTVNIGGNNFTDALAKSFKLTFLKAEELKKNAATSKYARQIYQAMRPIFADLVTEVQRSIGYYNSSHRDSNLERVIGMGTPFRLPNLQKYLEQNLNMEVLRLENFRKAVADGKLAAGLAENILAMPAAYGLAVQGLGLAPISTNLLPVEVARQMLWKAKRPWFAAAAACVIAGVGIQAGKWYTDSTLFASSQRSSKHSENDSAIAAQNALKTAFTGVADTYNQDVEQINSYMNLNEDRAFWPSVYNDIYNALPQNGQTEAQMFNPIRGKQNRIVLRLIEPQYNLAIPPVDTEVSAAPGGGGPPGAPAAPAAAAAGARRGFTFTISGYTPDSRGLETVKKYISRLKELAPQTGSNKRYYFEFSITPVLGQRITKAGLSGTFTGISSPMWNGTGPYATIFNPEFIQQPTNAPSPANPATPGATPPPGPGVPGAMPPPPGSVPGVVPPGPPPPGAAPLAPTIISTIGTSIDPDTKQEMVGDYVFELRMNLILRDVPPGASK